MPDCLFCSIIKGDIPSHKIYEDDETYAFLDIFPVSRGHLLVIPKEHAENITEGSHAAAIAIMRTVHHIAPKIMAVLGASRYNLGMNHGVDAGQEVFHTHMHIMPRYKGVTRAFEKTKPEQSELKEIADIIRSGLLS